MSLRSTVTRVSSATRSSATRVSAPSRTSVPRVTITSSGSFPINRNLFGMATVWFNVVHSSNLKEGHGGSGLLHYNTGQYMTPLTGSTTYGWDTEALDNLLDAQITHIRYGNDNVLPWLALVSAFSDAGRDGRPWMIHSGEDVPDWTGYGPLEAADLAATLGAELTIVLPVWPYNHMLHDQSAGTLYTQTDRNNAMVEGARVAINLVRYLYEDSPVPDGVTPGDYGTSVGWILPGFDSSAITALPAWSDIYVYSPGYKVKTTFRGRDVGWICVQDQGPEDSGVTGPPRVEGGLEYKGSDWFHYWQHYPDPSTADQEHSWDMVDADVPAGYWGWVRHSHRGSPDKVIVRGFELGNELYYQVSPAAYVTYINTVAPVIWQYAPDAKVIVSVGNVHWETIDDGAWNDALLAIRGMFDEVTLSGYYGQSNPGEATGGSYVSLDDYKRFFAKDQRGDGAWFGHGAGATFAYEHRFHGLKPFYCYEYNSLFGAAAPGSHTSYPEYYIQQHRWKSALALGVFLADMVARKDVVVGNYYQVGEFRTWNSASHNYTAMENDGIIYGEPGTYRINAEFEVLRRFGKFCAGELYPATVSGDDYIRAAACFKDGRARVFLINTDPLEAHDVELAGLKFGTGTKYTLTCSSGMEGLAPDVSEATAAITINAWETTLTLPAQSFTLLDVAA